MRLVSSKMNVGLYLRDNMKGYYLNTFTNSFSLSYSLFSKTILNILVVVLTVILWIPLLKHINFPFLVGGVDINESLL